MRRFLPLTRVAVLLAVAALADRAAAQNILRVAVPRATVALSEACTAAPGVLPEMRSAGGVLRGSLTMAPATYRLGGREVTSNVYNGGYNAPTLRVDLGERVELTIANRMRAVGGLKETQVDTTNQHYHGLVVTPVPEQGDNVTHVAIGQGGSNVNRYPLLPAETGVQSEGLMWYHPHPHSKTLPQVAGGLAGAMVVGDLLRYFPEYRGATERILVIKSSNAGSTPTLNVNGVECPRLVLNAAGDELWRILNATGNTFLNLKLTGYTFTALAFDGNAVAAPMRQDSLFVPPGGRVEAIVRGGAGPWSTTLVAAPFLKGPATPIKIADVRVVGLSDKNSAQVGARDLAARSRVNTELADSIRRLATATEVDRFTLRFSFGQGGALLNDSAYSPGRLDRAVQAERVQEWTLVNETSAPHTFHIHQTDFLITSINGQDVEADSVFFDNVSVGVHRNASGTVVGDTVTVRFKFHPVAVGPFVYHCHVLAHEDAGMMQNICVYPRGQDASYCARWFPTGSGGHSH
ncbi:MAG: multicopper oxidase family protein [Gemmatimonadetes bacterium]|nr:multicopper oxidase family protein [Gemmatimonadota bacterium]